MLLLKLLWRLGHPQATSANMTKQKMAMVIAGAVASFDDWSTGNVTNVHLAALCRDSGEVSSLAFGLELMAEPSVHLFFPAGGVLPPGVQLPNADAAATE